jgi:benzylsuccinate CoA-transferase BbsE subunit
MTSTATPSTTGGALAPYRVLDLTDELGALCPRLLAGLGADVIRIEPPAGHPTRRRGPFLDGVARSDRGLYWLQMNAGKRSVTLNLASADGRALFRRLLATADFLIESLPSGALDALGLPAEELLRARPRLVVTSISPFGRNGPRGQDPGSDLIGMAAGGLLFLCGDRDRPPVRPTVEQGYAQAGISAAAATLAGHALREQTGAGVCVDVSMQECVLWTLANNHLVWAADRVIPRRAGGGSAFGGVSRRVIYETADGYVGFLRRPDSYPTIKQWLAGAGVELEFDIAAWATMPRIGEGSPPEEQQAALEAALAEFFRARPAAGLETEGQGRGMIIADVPTPAHLAASPHLAERDYFARVDYPEFGRELVVPGGPAKLTATPWRTGRAPGNGEHNRAIYRDELGLTDAELVALKGAGAI